MNLCQMKALSVFSIIVVCQAVFVNGFWSTPPRTVCYEHVGCFNNMAPFENALGALPESPSSADVKLYSFTGNSLDAPIILRPLQSELPGALEIDTTKPVVFFIHGYESSLYKGEMWNIVTALYNTGAVNLIGVDWEIGAHRLYPQSAANARLVGAVVARFLRLLLHAELTSADRVYLIGVSLGAHVCGYAGAAIPGIGRITGLDPAGPLFKDEDHHVRLDSSDATFVDVIHTNAAPIWQLGFGIIRPCGHVDFYPNGGKEQPGCPIGFWLQLRGLLDSTLHAHAMSCSHTRASQYFAESITSACQFRAWSCSFSTIQDDAYQSCTIGGGQQQEAVMGYHASENLRGTFYLTTNPEAPFCQA